MDRTPQLPLESWRKVIGYHPFHFWQIADQDLLRVTSSCNDLVREYAWQDADQMGRHDIRQAILRAEDVLGDYLNFRVGRYWSDVTLQYPRPWYQGQQYVASINADGRWLNLRLPEGYIRNLGVETYATLSAGETVTYSDEDGDGIQETATITAATTVTNPDQIGIYFVTADRLDGAALSETWRIRPAQVTLSGGVATIKCKRWQLVKPIKYQGVVKNTIDPSAGSADFASTVDVVRRYNNPDGTTTDDCQAVLIWETDPYPAWATTCYDDNTLSFTTNATDPAAVAYGIARAGIRDARLGEISVGRAVYDSDTGEWRGASWGTCRQPDRVIVRYEAGRPLRSMENTLSQSRRGGHWDEVVARLAAAEGVRRICACDVANQELYHWRFDLARSAGANDEQYRIGDRDLQNPFGTLRGQVYAWHRVEDLMLTPALTL